MRPPQRINFQGNRRVFPVLGAYIGASFAFVGVADATLGNIGGPEWAFEYLIIALLAGFPVTFALAWFFQITKHGIIKHGSAEAMQLQKKTRAQESAGQAFDIPMLAIERFTSSGGNEQAEQLATGLRDDIGAALANNTALKVVSGDDAHIDCVLIGSIQASSSRIRLVFSLQAKETRQHVWGERFDRELDDIFSLQDDLVLHITSGIRSCLKTQLFEQLRLLGDDKLSVPQLLDKAAGSFHVVALDKSGTAIASLRRVLERESDNATAWCMLGFALYRSAEYPPVLPSAETRHDIVTSLDHAISLNSQSYVARTLKAMVLLDFDLNASTAATYNGEALSINANFIPAKAMHGIVAVQQGSIERGIAELEYAITIANQDASRFRWRRDLAVAYWLSGKTALAETTIIQLCANTPQMMRNHVVMAALMVASGHQEKAAQLVADMHASWPDLTLASTRLPALVNKTKRQEFIGLLAKAGL